MTDTCLISRSVCPSSACARVHIAPMAHSRQADNERGAPRRRQSTQLAPGQSVDRTILKFKL
eukprot:6812863-Prymnesium_polylepis.1